MTWVWGPSFPIEGFWGSPEAKAQDWWGQALWGRAVYTALHGARLSSVPSGDQSANPASVPGRSGLQRAFLSVSSAQKCSGAGKLATPSGVSRAARSAVPCRSSIPGHRASLSKYSGSEDRHFLRRLLRQSWCYIPGLMRAGPSGEERFTPHYTVPVSPQCPQEISLLTLPVFQGAAVSTSVSLSLFCPEM